MRGSMLLASLVLIPGGLPCQETEEVAADTVASITKELAAERSKWVAAYRKIKDKQERSAKAKTYPRPDAYRKRAWKLVRGVETTANAGDALIWIVQNGAVGDESSRALGLLQKHHLEHEKLGAACVRLMFDIRPVVLKFLRDVKAGTSNRDTQGVALYATAKVLMRRVGAARRLSDADEKLMASYTGTYGEDTVQELLSLDEARVEAKAHELLKQVQKEYADAKLRGVPLGKKAAGDLFEIEHLAIGKNVPDIDGEDIDGVAFKLSDYEGKVVVLDFWGDW